MMNALAVPDRATQPSQSRTLPPINCALVTGAASGIGRAFACALAARGENLILVDRDEMPLRRLADELFRRYGIRAEGAVIDLTDPDTPLYLARHCHRRRLRVSMLVNNAGVGFRAVFAEQARASMQQILDVNILALVRLTRLFLPRMIRCGTGTIVNVGSVAGFVPSPSTALYAASKAFVLSFTESLARETTGTGVHVANVCPGMTDTPLLDSFGLRCSRGVQTPEQVVEEALAGIGRGHHFIVTGSGNRIRVWAQRASLRWVLHSIRQVLRKVGI
jgi:uncharacterized protein